MRSRLVRTTHLAEVILGESTMNVEDLMLFCLGLVAVIGTAMWMTRISQRLEAISRAVHFIVDNTNALREIRDVLALIEGNTAKK